VNPPAFLWLITILLVAGLVVYFAGRRVAISLTQPLALAGLLVAWVPLLAWVGSPSASNTYTLGTVTLQADGLSLILAITTLTLGTVVIFYSRPYLLGEHNENHYYALLLILMAVIIGLGCATDLFNLWIWFEAMTLSTYFLVGFHLEQKGAIEATVKYLVQSAVGSVLILIAIALVLLQTGSLTFKALTGPAPVLQVAALLFLVGFGLKAALVPLHTWLPDAHSQAPSGISAMLSGVVIEAGLVAVVRTLSPLLELGSTWGIVLASFGALNMLVGNLLALRQTGVKRLLAYSSLSHMGYMLLGLGIAGLAGQPLAAQGAFFHLINHGLMKGLAFLAAGAFLYAIPKGHSVLTITDLSGAAQRYPWVALALSAALFSLSGLPPLAGFMSKWQIFAAGVSANSILITCFVIFAAFNSVLSLAYYIPLVNTLYRQVPSAAVAGGHPIPLTATLPLTVLALALLLLGLWPNALTWLTASASTALFVH